jgi:hypothetical protein
LQSYQVGRQNELDVLPVLRAFFRDERLEHTEDRFALFDFVSPTRTVEYRCRNCSVYYYNDVMMSAAKIEEAARCWDEKDYIFVFRFTEGLYYWMFDPKVDLHLRFGGRTDRGYDERQYVYFIPSYLLQKLEIST